MTILGLFQKTNGVTKREYSRRKGSASLVDRYSGLYKEPYFLEFLNLERKRSERSRRPFVLMLAELEGFEDVFEKHQVVKKMCALLSVLTRDTDIKGWYSYGNVMGIIFNEIVETDKNLKRAHAHLVNKCTNALRMGLNEIQFEKLVLTWHVFPGQFDKAFTEEPEDTTIYPDMVARRARKKAVYFMKRIIDIFGSFFLIVFLSPVFLIIACLIKFTSSGPILYKQERVGLFGKRFKFLKFRSMFVENDPTIHKEFVKNLISGTQSKPGVKENSSQDGIYKIAQDPRVTPVGHFLRKTSLDEMPQFWNVLCGEMSLVGPRPPIPYECEIYDVWHWRRVLEMKPGITGLWQVEGRSNTTFDEMVRMDLKYIMEWSIWMDMKILLKTPWAVFTGKGAY